MLEESHRRWGYEAGAASWRFNWPAADAPEAASPKPTPGAWTHRRRAAGSCSAVRRATASTLGLTVPLRCVRKRSVSHMWRDGDDPARIGVRNPCPE